MKTRFLTILMLCALVFTGCNPSDDNPGSNTTDEQFAQNFGASVQRDFIGQVVDKDNGAVAGATVTIGSSTVQTDANGVFIINDVPVHEKFAYVTVEKPGFIKGSRSLVPTSGKNNVKIMLIPATPVATISSGAAADVDLPNGTKITFDGAFETEDGSGYSGDVNVAAFHLETSDENISSLMPGMLFAKGEDGEAKVLSTFGMLNVELRGSAGQKLQIKSGHKAQISMKIDDSQTANSSQSIPLWHFDEAVGYWKQEGSATKQNGFYVGEVSHFSWWNCDMFSSTVTLTVTVQHEGVPVENMGIGLIVGTTGFASGVLISDSNGQVSGQIPANQVLTMNIYDSYGNVVQTSQIGPFNTDTTLSPSAIQSAVQMTTVMGNLLRCDNTPVTNGYVVVKYGNRNFLSAVNAGNFSMDMLVCNVSNVIYVRGYDIDNVTTTAETQHTLTVPAANLGNINTCNLAAEYVTFQVDGGTITNLIGEVTAFTDGDYVTITGTNTIGVNDFYLFGPSITPGIYTTSTYSVFSAAGGFHITWESVNNLTFNLSSFGPVGDYIDISFSGPYTNSLGENHTVSGSVHVIRDN